MSKLIKIDSEKIAEIRNALQVISLSAGTVEYQYPLKAVEKLAVIEKQVERISMLLPQVEFESNEEDCSICHGKGYTIHHHDPCTECDGSGKVGGGG